MSKHQTGSKNGQWKGGRTVASNGYVLIRVGKDHHLADIRGYAYEHRIVAEKILGRKLNKGEQVHHKDGNRTNNDSSNLEVMRDAKSHHRLHRSWLTQFVTELIQESPYSRAQLAELTSSTPKQVGWVLSRLKKNREACRSKTGDWIKC